MISKLRSSRIEIDLPTEDAEVWVRVTGQRVRKNEAYVTVQTVDRVNYTHRSVPQFATQMVSVVDPVTGQTLVASGAGVATLIKALVLTWLQADHGGTVNEVGDLIEDS